MAQFGPSQQTAQVTTGNFRTVLDKYDSTKLNNGAQNPLGMVFYDNTVSLAYPNGLPTKYRYVRYNSTANSAVKAFPGVVYWQDNGRTTVTSTYTESVSGGLNAVAGYMMVNSTDLTTLTATLLNGNFVWIAVAGYVKGAGSITSAAIDDSLIGSSTAWLPARVAAGTAPTGRPIAWVYTAIASSVSDVDVCVESL